MTTKKIDQEEFLRRSKEKHGDKYDYSKAIYTGKDEKVILICPIHGEFSQRAGSHYKYGCQSCGQMGRTDKRSCQSTEAFMKKANKLHGDKYTYEKTLYVNHDKDIVITCPIHGDFNQTPHAHMRGRGCSKCGAENASEVRAKTTESFIKQAVKVHGDKYDYSKSNYITSKVKIEIVCPVHGSFWQAPASHSIQGCGCDKCAEPIRRSKKRLTQAEVIKRLVEKHGDRYDFSLVEYKTYHEKIKVICKIHGVFEMRVAALLHTGNCQRCHEDLFLNVFRKSEWIKRAKGRIGTFYILRLFSEKEDFYKLGITFVGLKGRYGLKARDMPYDYEVIHLEENSNLSYIYEKEKKLKSLIKDERYKPIIHFSGDKTECFTDIKKVLKAAKDFKNDYEQSISDYCR